MLIEAKSEISSRSAQRRVAAAPVPVTDRGLRARRRAELSIGAGQIDVTLLLFFAEVAETLSFTRAAQRLGIDQSWLSQKIQQLERMLGLTLFVRDTRNVELTRAGETLLEPVRRLSRTAEEARAATELLRKSLVGSVRIGALPFSYPDAQRALAMDNFVDEHPDVEMIVHNAPTPQLLEKLRMGQVDLAFVSAPFDDSRLDCLLMREDHYCLVTPEDHPIAQHEVLEAKMLAGMRIVMPARHFSPQAYAMYYEPLVEAGIVPIDVPEFQSAATYGQQWRMPTICTEYAAEQSLRKGDVVRRIADVPPCRKYLARLSSHRTPSQIAFWDIVAKQLKKGRPVRSAMA